MFQFTHPGKGATRRKESDYFEIGVSIHAPWEGCDLDMRFDKEGFLEFQFTHPGKGATRPSSFRPW